MNARRRAQAGFTLMEVLVASVLLSIVMTAVYTLFYSVLSVWRSEENDEGLHRQTRLFLNSFSRDFGSMIDGGTFLFEGAEDDITMFVAAQPLDVESGEGRRIMKVRYYLDRRGGTLVREEAIVDGPLPANAADAEKWGGSRLRLTDEASFVVASGVTHFEIKYLWIQRPDSGYWGSKPAYLEPRVAKRHHLGWGLPQGLEIDLTLEGRAQDTPSLSTQVRLATCGPNRQRDAWELSKMLEADQ